MTLVLHAQPQSASANKSAQSAPADKSVGKPSPETKLTEDDRKMILRSFASEMVFIHTLFPMGKVGLTLDTEGKLSPTEQEVAHLIAQYGPAVKPGDRAKITDVIFKKNGIIFEINGGPVKKKKWYERLEVSGAGASSRPADRTGDTDPYQTNSRGSYAFLQFKDHIPSVTPEQLQALLAPVFDFKAVSVAEAYQKSLPPKLADAVKNHRALVGMDREMVTYAKGRPPKRHREAEGDNEYEEWIYGQPPNDVEFIRFVGDRVVRIETMKVDGEKIIRTEDELAEIRKELAQQKQEEKEAEAAQQAPTRTAPTLVRPGETPANNDPGNRPKNPAPATTGTSPTPPR
jgi:hypothetical protein